MHHPFSLSGGTTDNYVTPSDWEQYRCMTTLLFAGATHTYRCVWLCDGRLMQVQIDVKRKCRSEILVLLNHAGVAVWRTAGAPTVFSHGSHRPKPALLVPWGQTVHRDVQLQAGHPGVDGRLPAVRLQLLPRYEGGRQQIIKQDPPHPHPQPRSAYGTRWYKADDDDDSNLFIQREMSLLQQHPDHITVKNKTK